MSLVLKLSSMAVYFLLTLSAGVILIFANISAISTDLVPSALKYTSVDTSTLAEQLTASNGELDVSVSDVTRDSYSIVSRCNFRICMQVMLQ